MMWKKKSLLGALCLLVVAALICAGTTFAATEEVEVIGTVLATEWDANDNVTAVVIATEEGEDIAVSNSGKGIELLKLDEMTVKATGWIATDEDGKRTITVSKYIVQE